MEVSNIILSFGLTLLVGSTMGFGSILSFFVKGDNKKFLVKSLSFAAGIMIYVSFMAILPEGIHMLEGYLGHEKGYNLALTFFFVGIIITAILEHFTHKIGGGHGHDHDHGGHSHGEHLSKLGLVSAIAIAIHNLPEGFALFTAGLKDIRVAIPIALAITMHNIPLSIAISVPIYYSTKSKKKTFFYTLLVGLCQPLGALLGYLLLSKFLNDFLFGILFSIISGIMVFVSLDELLPTAQKYDDHHIAIYGAVAGMAVMAISLIMFGHVH